jgi:hypothetical protein
MLRRPFPLMPRVALLSALLVATLSAEARAQSLGLVLLDVAPPSAPGNRWPEAEARTRAELESAGLSVAEVGARELDAERSLDSLSRAARGRHAVAAARIVRFEHPASAEVWIVDEVTGKGTFRRVPLDDLEPSQATSVVALSVVELLNASLLELRAGHVARGPQAPTEGVYRLVDRSLGESAPPYRVALRGGASVMGSPGGLGLTAGPALAFGLGLLPSLALEVDAAASLIQSSLSGPAGTERVGLGFARLELVWRSSAARRLQAQIGLGGGALFVWAHGTANDHYTAHEDFTACALPSAVASVALRVSRSLRLRVGSGAGFALPRVSLAMAGVTVASAGRPLLDGSLALEWVWAQESRSVQ